MFCQKKNSFLYFLLLLDNFKNISNANYFFINSFLFRKDAMSHLKIHKIWYLQSAIESKQPTTLHASHAAEKQYSPNNTLIKPASNPRAQDFFIHLMSAMSMQVLRWTANFLCRPICCVKKN